MGADLLADGGSQVTIPDEDVFHFLTKTCNPPLGDLYRDLRSLGCEMKHLRAMSRWSRTLLSDTLERLRARVERLEEDNDHDAEKRKSGTSQDSMVGTNESKASIMDWEVLRYHIIEMSP